LSTFRSAVENPAVVRLREFYRDAAAPSAQDVLPAAFAAVRNPIGEILLVHRIDDGNWELPGGRIEVGESAAEAVIREVAEESGVTIELTGLAGVYSDPTHILVDPGDVIHQQLALCFHAVPAPDDAGAQPRPDDVETDAAAWFSTAEVSGLAMHPAMRLRIEDAVHAPDHPHFE
jgi:8-oxo-dGTP pyrophosphatase MutT (NUDIX family)